MSAETQDQAEVRPRKGMRFAHATQLEQVPHTRVADWPAMVCSVTRVGTNYVWFVNTTGYHSKVARERFPGIVKEVLG
jgi:hypothetical protein